MELVIKLYNDKASRIAVKFIYEYQAVKEYETLVRNYPNDVMRMRLEFVKKTICLTLESEASGGKVVYKELEYKAEQVKKLQNFYIKGMPLQFVHIFPKANQLLVAKPFRSQSFFDVSDLEIILPVNADY